MFKLRGRPKPVIIEDDYLDYSGRYSRRAKRGRSYQRLLYLLLILAVGISSLLWRSAQAVDNNVVIAPISIGNR